MKAPPVQELLLTPGPVSLPMSTKQVMLTDRAFGSESLRKDLKFARRYLLRLANAERFGTTIPLPGSGTNANEALIRTLVPAGGKLLIHSNGIYGDTLVAICRAMGTRHAVLRTSLLERPVVDHFRQALSEDAAITHVMMVHCETSSGLLNPIGDVAEICREFDKVFMIDAVATFGALSLDMRKLSCQAITISSNKCLEGPPGLAWVIAERALLDSSKGNARSLSLDLWDQNQHIERTECFRFTPPTHVVAAVAQALREHEREGGSVARLRRYRNNHRQLLKSMRELGFETLLPDELVAPILATFRIPHDPYYSFDRLYQAMKDDGFELYPGPMAVQRAFRIGCIGALGEEDIRRAVQALARAIAGMGVGNPGSSGTQAA